MIQPDDVERMVAAHERVRKLLEAKEPRRAAKAVCEEFRWLLEDKGSFWAEVGDATKTLAEHRKQEQEILSRITQLLEAEESIFARLGIDASRSGPILANAYGGLLLVRGKELDIDPSPETLAVLRERLGKATELVCRESKGPLRQALDWAVSWKGATVLAGSAIVSANVAVTMLSQNHAVSWVSLKAGVKVMVGEIEGLIDLFS